MHKYSVEKCPKTKITALIAILSVFLSSIIKFIFSTFNITFFSIGTLAIFGILYFIYSRWIWNIPCIKKLLKYPDLNGSWKISGMSCNQNNDQREPWEGILTIIQTWDKVLITLKTEKSYSTSKSTEGTLKYIDGVGYTLSYKYLNKPNSDAPRDMHSHVGSCELIFDQDVLTATGDYFNNGRDRQTHGSMRLIKEA